MKGKVNPLSSQMGAYQSVLARALAGQGQYREALDHAQLAGAAYTGDHSNLQAIKDNAAKTQQLIADLQTKVNGSSSN